MNFARYLTIENQTNDAVIHNPLFIITNSLSTIACLYLFYRGCRINGPMRTAFKLILLTGLCDFLCCILNFALFIDLSDSLCQMTSFLRAIALWMGLFCCSLISLLSYLTLKEFGSFSIIRTFRLAIFGSVFLSILLATM